jgi:putative membrane protein
MIKNFILGLFISIADLVPGISGGTIMIISGKYHQIIHCVNKMMKFDFDKESNKFIFPILIGWIIGIGSFVKLIDYLMKYYRDSMYGLFSGLIIGGVIYLFKDIKKNKKISIFTVFISFAISITVFVFLNYVKVHNAEISWWYLFLSAFVASVVMPLPGISGSTMFLIFGVYSSIIEYISHFEIIKFFPILVGMILGWFSTVKVLNLLFEKYKTTILEILLGITLAGAIKIIPFSRSLYPYLFIFIGLFASIEIETFFQK